MTATNTDARKLRGYRNGSAKLAAEIFQYRIECDRDEHTDTERAQALLRDAEYALRLWADDSALAFYLAAARVQLLGIPSGEAVAVEQPAPHFSDPSRTSHADLVCWRCEESMPLVGNEQADRLVAGAFLREHRECKPEREFEPETPGVGR
jgi:hypothetical protein